MKINVSSRWIRAGLLVLLSWHGQCVASGMPLGLWRAEAARILLLADNDVVHADEQARKLASELPSGAPATDTVRLLNLRARIALYRARTAEAASLSDQAYALALRHGDLAGQAEADLVAALNTVNQGNFDRLITVTARAVKALDGIDRPELLSEAMLRMAMMYHRFGKIDESVDACVRNMDLARRSRQPLAMAYAHQCMAIAYNQSDNNKESLQQYHEMQAQAQAAGSRLLEALALAGQGGVVAAQGDVTAGNLLVRQATAIYRAIGLPFYVTAGLFAEASHARMRGDHARAVALLDEAVDTYERLPNKTGLWWALTARSTSYVELKRLAAAEADLQRSLRLARELGLALYLSESEQLLGRLDARRGEYRQAYEHAQAAADMTAQANRRKISTRVLELTERYEQQARQREIADLTRRNEQQQVELRERELQQRWMWTVLGAIALVLAVLAFFLVRLRRSHRMLAAANDGLRQSQQAVQRQTDILQSVLDSLGDGVAVADAQGRLVLVNPAAERIVGLRREEQGARWPDDVVFYHSDRRTPYPRDQLPLARAVRGSDAGEGEEIYLDGAEPSKGRWLHMTARPLAGAQCGAVAVISDITGRKRAEAEILALNSSLEFKVQQRTGQLRQQTRYLRVLIDTIPWQVWFKDTDSHYLAANLATARELGCDADDMPGKSDFDVYPPEVARAARADDMLVMHSRVQQTVEEVRTGPGGTRWVEVFKAPVLDDDGTVLGTVGLARDISARKEAEAARDAALLEAQRLARLRSDFVAQMSHELRTPLNAVLGFAQLLWRDARLDAEQRSSVEAIRNSGEHLLGLINNVLDAAKLEAGKVELFAAPFDLRAELQSIAGMVGIRTAEKNLEFVCDVGADVPPMLVADGQRLRQVLLNLLSNAVKFTDRGRVALRVMQSEPGRVRFEVGDSGIGIGPGQLETIFQPFEQVGEAQRRLGGTGLGLAISRQFVRMMGSEIQVESRPGQGSVFWFDLPAPMMLPLHTPASGQAEPEIPARDGADTPPLTPPPAEEMAVLQQLARLGNMRAIQVRAEHLERLDPRYQPFAEQLRTLARGYQSKALRQLVDSYAQVADAEE
ncbi:PAS domain-containing protein [Duganella sp. FT92W]|uniref:Virulence sensor protein BvgS n=1 Tax=Pseudoduganella rivuli TaxID=2666085 RepID=A0A7X2LUI4_9BURK|nr:PAS domain-containing protein [Pseudoduganella rivuli]MRV74446.1 PAS domain-containing protein [Pseudoduganella rivuli]